MLSYKIIDISIQLGPDLSPQEWSAALQRHQEVMAEKLKTISPDDERYADIERAARGLWHSEVVGRIQ